MLSKIIGEVSKLDIRKLKKRRREVQNLLDTKGRIPKEEHTSKEVLRMELGDIDSKIFKQHALQIMRDTGFSLDKVYEDELNKVSNELLRRASPLMRTSQRIASKKHKGIIRSTEYTELPTESLDYYAQELTYHVEDWPEQSDKLKKAIERVQNARSERARIMDSTRTAKIAPTYEAWLNHPNKFDIEGIDTKTTEGIALKADDKGLIKNPVKRRRKPVAKRKQSSNINPHTSLKGMR